MSTRLQKERNERMFNAALREFSLLGFHQANVDSIAHNAGVSKATLYNHFPTKEAMFLAVFEQVLHVAMKLPEIDPLTTSIEDAVKLGIRQLFTRVAETPEIQFFFRCLTSDFSLLNEELRARLSESFVAASFGEMRQSMRAQQAGQIYAHLDLELIHHAILGIILQTFRFWWSQKKRYPVEKISEQLSEFILFGIAIRGRSTAKTKTAKLQTSTGKRRKQV
ncbi:MAG TPA: TetR/AcrR family transcriptional regulator [Candidatus Rifleibacterium sp.]|nr:TetR/AcrR family transcriptional regulator [Candidatus Rifleibacterium sp.]